MITKALAEQWANDWIGCDQPTMSQHQYIAQRAAAHGAAQRDAELMGVGMEPFAHYRHYDDGVQDWPSKDTIPLYTATQLAAARLQGAEDERLRMEQEDSRCPTCGEDGGTSCGAPNCGLLMDEMDAQLMEQNTALGDECARLERVNQGLLEACKALLMMLDQPTRCWARSKHAPPLQQPKRSKHELAKRTLV